MNIGIGKLVRLVLALEARIAKLEGNTGPTAAETVEAAAAAGIERGIPESGTAKDGE